ncbi:hypothetical protein LTR28_007969 [Elasticomyces elasticus]|nr:hypothetical protein LTR28_007969 [Elasticomyces elasticus]
MDEDWVIGAPVVCFLIESSLGEEPKIECRNRKLTCKDYQKGLVFRATADSRTMVRHVDELVAQTASTARTPSRFVRISPTEVSISDLDSFKTIHRVGSGFQKSEWYLRFNESAHPGIFAMTDPKQHAARRRLFAQPFSNSYIQTFEPAVRQKVNLAVAKIKRGAASGSADILKWFTFMATDVSGELSFGRSFDMLQREEKNPYIRDLETALMIAGMRSELRPLFTIASYIPWGTLQHTLAIDKRLSSYGEKAVQNHKAHVVTEKGPGATSLFSKFLDPAKNQELSDADIAQEASNLIVAGSDTTAVSLTYLVWAVLHPANGHVRKTLESEIDRLPPDARASDLTALPYLRAVVDETLRLYGAAPGSLPRVVPAAGTTLGPYHIPGGVTVSTQAFTMHRDPSIFVDPERFDPSRWERPTQEMKDAYSPFGAGSRTCIGMHLAMLELLLGAFIFFKRCPEAVLAPATTDESMEFVNYFLIAPKSHRCLIRSH